MATVSCPECGTRLKVKDGMAGRTVKCPKCGEPIRVTDEDEARPTDAERSRAIRDGAPKAKRPAANDERDDRDEEERPKRRRDDDDEEEEEEEERRPRRKKKRAASNKGLIIALCVGALVLVGGGITLIIVLTSKGGGNDGFKVAKDGPKKDAVTDRGPVDKEPPRDLPDKAMFDKAIFDKGPPRDFPDKAMFDKAMFDKGIPRDFADKAMFDKTLPTDKGGPVGGGDGSLIGTWTAFEGESLGMKLSGRDVNMRYDFAVGKVTYTISGVSGSGSYSINEAANPKTIDIRAASELGTFNMLAIYKIEGDTLTICLGRDVRPAKFSSAGIPFGTMYVMKRGTGGGSDPFKDFKEKFKDFNKEKFKDFFKDKRVSGGVNLPPWSPEVRDRARRLEAAATRRPLHFFTDMRRQAC